MDDRQRRRLRRSLIAAAIALLGPLPLPHLDSYLPAALGLFFALVGVAQSGGPTYLAYMVGVLAVYFGIASLLLLGLESLLARRKRGSSAP
jgi:hypothetical protein